MIPQCTSCGTPLPPSSLHSILCERCRFAGHLESEGASIADHGQGSRITKKTSVVVVPDLRSAQVTAAAHETNSHIFDTPPPLKAVSLSGEARKSVKPAGSCPTDSGSCEVSLVPNQFPGYRIERLLGVGGMGSVYLARQLSLDRPVALKVMSLKWSADPVFVARFTREAFAAALLSHTNVVQIYDIGELDGVRYFSMEFVEGRSLLDVVKREGKLDPEVAVGYVLQAARGLKHAHDRGLIHRDVKPDNLLLDEHGIVKVADLGLVKTPDTPMEFDRPSERIPKPGSGILSLPADVTGVRIALGTPAYMAPEQCRDAATVDHRADIYSLGCTLYVLVTGRPPFDGNTAVELMTKHAYEPLLPPEALVNRVPKELSAIIQRMMTKDAAGRYSEMGEVIRVLEDWLGVHRAANFTPRDAQVALLEKMVQDFNEAPAVVVRRRVVSTVMFGCVLGAVLFLFFRKLNWAFGLAGLVSQAAAAYFILNGVAKKTYLFRRVRQLVFSCTVGDCLAAVAGVVLFAVLLWMLNLFWVWIGCGCLGLGLAIALRYGLDLFVEESRWSILNQCEMELRRMRLAGVAEEELRLYVAKFGGVHWEEFYEELFGYEAKIAMRSQLSWGHGSRDRERYASWREPILALIDRIEANRKAVREKKLLADVEKSRLVASGMSVYSAGHQADAAASALLHQAEAARSADSRRRRALSNEQPRFLTPAEMPNLRELLAQAEYAKLRPARTPAWKWCDRLANAVVGPHVRVVLAALLLAACTLWIIQNRLVERLLPGATAADVSTVLHPMKIDGIASKWTAWVDTINVGWAGLLLLVSLYSKGHRMAFMVILGGAITVFGHKLGIATVEPIRDYHVSMMLGSVLALIGYRLGHEQ